MSYSSSSFDSTSSNYPDNLSRGYAVEKETTSKVKVSPAYNPSAGTKTRKMHIADVTQKARSNLVKSKAILGNMWDPMMDNFIQNPELKSVSPSHGQGHSKPVPAATSPVSAMVKSSSGATVKGKYFMALRSIAADRSEVIFCQNARVAVVVISASCFFIVDLEKQVVSAILSGVGSLVYWHHESLYLAIRPNASLLVIVSLQQIKTVARIMLTAETEKRARVVQIRGDTLLLENRSSDKVTEYWLIKLPGHNVHIEIRPEARVKLPLGLAWPTLSSDGTVLSFWTGGSAHPLDEKSNSWDMVVDNAAKGATRTQVRVSNYFARKTTPTDSPSLQMIELAARAASVSASIRSFVTPINSEVSLAFEPGTGSSYLLYNQSDLVKSITGASQHRVELYRSKPTPNIISPAPFDHVPVIHMQGTCVSGLVRSKDNSVWVNDAAVVLTPVQNNSNQIELRVSHSLRPRGGIEPIHSSKKNLVLLPESSMIAYLDINGCLSRRVDCSGGELFVVLDKR
jgi:hypothetical protein